jgi:hypothetical protein
MPEKPLSRKVAARLRRLAAVLVAQLDEEPEAAGGWEAESQGGASPPGRNASARLLPAEQP